MINYVCSCLGRRAKPEEIRDELALVLDEDAQIMVVKLWRVLLFHAARAAQRCRRWSGGCRWAATSPGSSWRWR